MSKGGLHFSRRSGAESEKYLLADPIEAYYTQQHEMGVAMGIAFGGRVEEERELAPGGFARWVDGNDPATGMPKGATRAGRKERQPLRFVEKVINNPKSLSIVASQNELIATALDKVMLRQAQEIAAYLNSVTVTRIGPRGAQREVGGLTTETARVTHLTSREGDPYRHIHLMLNVRVKTEDGTWHGLYTASLVRHIAAVNALATRVIQTDNEFRKALALQGYTLGVDGEIDQARAAVKSMSKRSMMTAANRERIEVKWRSEKPGAEPTQKVKNLWDQQAWAKGRKPKGKIHESPDELSERVRLELAAAGFDFTPGSRKAIEWKGKTIAVGEVQRQEVAADAVAVLSSQKSAWGEADLTAEVQSAVGRSGVVGELHAVTELVEDCRHRAKDLCLSLLDPSTHTPTSMSRHFSSQAVVDADINLNLGLVALAGGSNQRDPEAGVLAESRGLDPGQAQAAEAICGEARLEVVVGPAGTGKTATLSLAKERLESQGRKMVIVAPTRKAAMVAGEKVGTDSASLSKLLHEHGFRWDQQGRWRRLANGQQDTNGFVYRGPIQASVLSKKSVIVVDEAGLITVDQANALVELVADSGAALRLVGDPRQLGAVGRGGVMETAARWSGEAVVLDQVHRFLKVTVEEDGVAVTGIDSDYADLSLAIRQATNPEEVADRLFERGSVTVHAIRSEALAAMATEIVEQGNDKALAVTVATNDDANDLNQAIRERRVLAGIVDDDKTTAGMDGVTMGAGDRVVTRRNDAAKGVANRQSWTVESVTEEGGILASNGRRQITLEHEYVKDAVQLGYASTDYGNQGVTADASITWVTEVTTAAGLYVGATRGRFDNALHLVAEDETEARQLIVSALRRDRADRGLEAARILAESEAIPTAEPKLAFNPAGWRTEVELDAAATRIEGELACALLALRDLPVMSDEQLQEDNRADLAIATTERQRAVEHRTEATRIRSEGDQLVKAATSDFMSARADAASIVAGAGFLGRKASQLDQAEGRLKQTARRWSTTQLPGSQWSDDYVRRVAAQTAERITNTRFDHHTDLAEQAERTTDVYDRRIIARDRDRTRSIHTNASNALRRETLVADSEVALVRVARYRRRRFELVATMTSEEIALADHSRNLYVADQASQRTGGQEVLALPVLGQLKGPSIPNQQGIGR